jgi:hypothetical protein
MEFSYTVSESDYLAAWKLRRAPGLSKTLKTVMFWVFILVCLMVLWGFVTRTNATQPVVEPEPANSDPVHALIVNVLPFVLILCIWVFMLIQLGPQTIRRLYRKDPLMKGVFTVKVTPESFAITNTAGFSSESRWSLYQSWREGKKVIALLMPTGGCSVLVLSDLSEPQRNELRGLLASALPGRT